MQLICRSKPKNFSFFGEINNVQQLPGKRNSAGRSFCLTSFNFRHWCCAVTPPSIPIFSSTARSFIVKSTRNKKKDQNLQFCFCLVINLNRVPIRIWFVAKVLSTFKVNVFRSMKSKIFFQLGKRSSLHLVRR